MVIENILARLSMLEDPKCACPNAVSLEQAILLVQPKNIGPCFCIGTLHKCVPMLWHMACSSIWRILGVYTLFDNIIKPNLEKILVDE